MARNNNLDERLFLDEGMIKLEGHLIKRKELPVDG